MRRRRDGNSTVFEM